MSFAVRCHLLSAAFLAVIAVPSLGVAQSVPIVFRVAAGTDSSKVFIQFLGGNVTGTYNNHDGVSHPVNANVAYSLAEITSPVSVGGGAPAKAPALLMSSAPARLYINFGSQGLQGMGEPGSNYIPAANAATDPNYSTRYQYIESGIVGAQVNADLTYIDFTAISISMRAIMSPHAQNNPQRSGFGQRMVTAAANSGTTANDNVLPKPADVLPSASFARVISPQLGASGEYHDFTHYLKTTLQGQTVRIAGTYVGTGKQPSGTPATQAQSYDYNTTFNAAGDLTMTANPGSGNGSAPGVPQASQGPGIGDTNETVTATFADLNAITGIYGNNSPYTIGDNGKITVTTGITNDVWGQVVGDLLAGLSYGFPASQTMFMGTPIGQLSSTEWWGGGAMPDGTFIEPSSTPGGNRIAFGSLQPSNLDYNLYAASLFRLTTGYALPLGDRLGSNLLSFNTQTDVNSYLQIRINADNPPAP